jgi:hypothetical protein
MTPQDYIPEEYQQEPPTPGYEYSAVQSSPDATFARQVDPRNMLADIKHILRGDAWDDEHEKWIKVQKPQINEIGLRSIMADLYPLVNQNTTLSELDKEEISKMIISIANRIVAKIAVSGEDFGIDESNYSTFLNDVRYIIFITLKRSQDGGERKLWRTTIRSSDSRVSRPEEKKEGFFGRFMR